MEALPWIASGSSWPTRVGARVLERAQPRAALQEVKKLRDELAHVRWAELRRDAKGRLHGKGERFMGHTAEPETELHRRETR